MKDRQPVPRVDRSLMLRLETMWENLILLGYVDSHTDLQGCELTCCERYQAFFLLETTNLLRGWNVSKTIETKKKRKGGREGGEKVTVKMYLAVTCQSVGEKAWPLGQQGFQNSKSLTFRAVTSSGSG